MWATPSALPFQNLLSKSLGQWGGMAIIAIGPRGGKIVGYGTGGKPIYAGSPKAQALSQYRRAAEAAPAKQLHDLVNEWLVEVGVPNKVVGHEVLTNESAGQMILDSYGIKPKKAGTTGAWRFDLGDFKPHIGKPLVPHGAEKVAWAAKAASGELDKDPFPKDLTGLSEIPAGKAAGSHGNRLFKSPDGRKWLFKTHDNVIARAEEAASRLGRLVFGPDLFAAAKYVKLAGQDGVLMEWKDGAEIPQTQYHQTTEEFIGQHFEHLIEHQVFDWLISNHDSHAGNFLVKDGQLIAIDKGQAWRFFGKDELSADYSPNPSKPVYVKLWGMVAEGKTPKKNGDPFEAASRVLERVEKITPEQYREIIAPYVATRAKKEGKDPKKLADQMVARLQNLRTDWAKFLAGETKSSVTEVMLALQPKPKPGVDVATKPATVQTKEKPVKLVEPEQPTVIEGGAKAPVPTSKPAAGWPQTKGKVTISHPGNPPPAKWPTGYPGPGFQASIDYKHKHYDVEFKHSTGPSGMRVVVYYPDGKSMEFDSPNKASDSLYLFHQGLPLTMSATEKKAKGISYPASKAFGILAFKSELTEAQGGELPASAKTVEELEADGTVQKDQATAPADAPGSPGADWKKIGSTVHVDEIAAMPIGTELSWHTEPGLVFAEKHGAGGWTIKDVTGTYKIGNDDLAARLTEATDDEVWTLPAPQKKPSAPNWETMPEGDWVTVPPGTSVDKWIVDALGGEAAIASKDEKGYTVSFFTKGVGWVKNGAEVSPNEVAEHIAKFGGDLKKIPAATPEPVKPPKDVSMYLVHTDPVGTKYVLETLDDQKEVWTKTSPGTWATANKVAHTDDEFLERLKDPEWSVWQVQKPQPLKETPPALKETVVKKPGLGNVVLQPKADGTYTVEFTFKDYNKIENFKTISAAAKFAFVHQKGYASIADYEAATGKKAPGVSWGYFGLDPKQQAAIVAAPAPAPAVEAEAPAPVTSKWMPPEAQEAAWVSQNKPPIETVEKWAPGTLVKLHAYGKDQYWKNVDGVWKLWNVLVEKWVDGPAFMPYVKGADTIAIVEPEAKPTAEFPEGGVSLVTLSASKMETMPAGTELGWKVEGLGETKAIRLIKQPDETWKVYDMSSGAQIPSLLIGSGTAHQMWNTYWSHEDGGAYQKEPPVAPGYKPFLQTGGLPTTAEQLAQLPKETKIKIGKYVYVKHAGQWDQYDEDGSWWHAFPYDQMAELVHGKKALVKPPSPSKLPSNVVLPSVEGMPPATHEIVNGTIKGATAWSIEKVGPTQAPIGMKPPAWAPWVPPPGVMIEGTANDKKFWITTAVSGYGSDGACPNVALAVLDEQGVLHKGNSVSGKLAMKSLTKAFEKAGIDLKAEHIKKFWNLDKIVFAPGETYLTVKDGTGPSEIPMASTVVKEPAAEMPPVMKKQIVKAAFPFNAALKKHPVGKEATLTPQKNGKYHWLAIPNGTTDQLAQLVKDFGLDEQVIGQLQQVNDGAKVLIPSWAVNHEVVITTTAFVAASAPKTVGPDNFETMPDGVPMQFTGNESDGEVQAALQKFPLGTSIVEGSLVYTLSDAGWSLITHEGQKKLTEGEAAHMVALYGGTVVPPGVEKPEYVAPTFTPKVEWKVTAEAAEKAAKAKAALAWSKGHPPVTETDDVFVLSHLQALLGPKVKFWARLAGGGTVLVGSESPKFAKAMKAAGLGWDEKPNVKTPFGSMKRYNLTALKDALPSAGTLTGPDGNTYPAGTTFEQKVVTKSIQNFIEGEPAFYKFSDHKTDSTKQVLKIKGTGAEQIAAANAIIQKYGINAPGSPGFNPDFGPITGSGNTIVPILKSKLAEVAETKTVTVPQVPPQPPAFYSQPLPFEGAAAAVGQPIGNNRHDLKMLDALKPSRLGHPILIGKNVWRDGQVFVRKVRDKSGTTRYEIHGDLPFFDASKTKGMTAATVTYQSTAGTNYKGYSYGQQTYEAETGTQVDDGSKSGRSYSGERGTTPGGSTVWVTTSGTSSVKGTFRVDVAPGQDPEKELAAACEMVGLNVEDAMAEPTADDLRVLKKIQIVQSLMGPVGFGGGLKPEQRNEEYLDAKLKDFKVPAEKIESAELRVVANGKIATVLADDDKIEVAKSKGLRFVYVGHESVGGLVSRVREGGYASNKRRCQNGVVGNPTSMQGDENVGGSWAVFARIAHTDQGSGFGGVKGGSSPKIVFHPRVLNRTDWYWHSGDKYGSTHDGTSSRYTAMNDGGGTSNEILFVDSLSMKDAAGIAVWDNATKQEVMQELIAAGFAEGVNGIPLDKFVIATATGNRDEIANMMEGLKPGVLP